MTLARLFKLLVFDMGARVLGSFIVLFIQLDLARRYPAADVAAVLLTMSVASILSLLVSGGHSFLAIASIAKFRTRNNAAMEQLFNRISYGDMLVIFAFIAVLVLGAYWALNISRELGLALLFGLASTPFSALLRYNAMLAIATGRYRLSMLENYLRPGLFGVLIVLNAILGWQLPIIYIIAGFVAANATACVILHLALQKDALPLTHARISNGRFSKAIRSRAIALLCVLGIAGTLSDFVTFLAGLFLDVEDVAKVGIAVRLAAVAGFAIQSVQQFSLADLAKLRGRDQVPLLRRANVLMVGAMMAAVGGAVLLGKFALNFFGATYVTAYAALILFMLAQVVRAAGGLNQNLLTLAGKHLSALWGSVLSLAVLVVAWIILVPFLGIVGAGFASIASEAAAAFALAYIAQKQMGYRGDAFAVFGSGHKVSR